MERKRTSSSWLATEHMVVAAIVVATLARFVVMGTQWSLSATDVTAYHTSGGGAAMVRPSRTWRHLREAAFFYRHPCTNHNTNIHNHPFRDGRAEGAVCLRRAHDAGWVRLPLPLLPWLFPVLSRLDSSSSSSSRAADLAVGIFLTVLDIWIGLCLAHLVRQSQTTAFAVHESRLEESMPNTLRPPVPCSPPPQTELNRPRKNMPTQKTQTSPTFLQDLTLPQKVLLMYYCNPFAILSSCLFHDLDIIPRLLHLLSLLTSYKGNAPLSTFLLSISCHFDFHSIMQLVPIALLVATKHGSRTATWGCLFYFFLWTSFCAILSSLLWNEQIKEDHTGDYFRPIPPFWWFQEPETSPNLGMMWYFLAQNFLRFKTYFAVLFNGLPFIFFVPFCLRLWQFPLELATLFYSVSLYFQSSMTLPDIIFMLLLMTLSPKSLCRMNRTVLMVSLLSLPVPVSLFVMDHWLWLTTGSGNPNYLYFQCLGIQLFLGLILSHFVSGSVQRYKALKLTQKELSNTTTTVKTN